MATPLLGAIENVSLIMIELDDINGMAAEYVLGTLNAAERAQVAARRMREPALEAAIVEWETLLAPLNELVAGIAPPTGIYEQIIKRLSGLGISKCELPRINCLGQKLIGQTANLDFGLS